jgi:hypothetical protein
MELKTLTAISPVDGRYRDKVAELDEFFFRIRPDPVPGDD